MNQTVKPELRSPLLIPGKSADRVHPAYKFGTDDWKAEYNMLLMDGVTCKSCASCSRCVSMFGSNETDTSCQWHPNRFRDMKLREGGVGE